MSRARAARVWEDPQWRRLGHWKPAGWSGRLESDGGPGFFLTPDGARDPRGELEATVAALFLSTATDGGAPRCRFPARAAWLTRRLALDAAALAPADCAAYDEWRRLLDAGSVSMIFASSYLDNPSSMFGHTFLRVERRAMDDGQRLRDNTLNFSADTGADGGMLFAVKGLLGLYPGRYTAAPYYMKIQTYNNMENRDLWEYRLALSSAEVDRLAAHAWEMGQAAFPYYFFSRNCSYQLMPALEAASPRLSLMPGSPPIVGPIDTVVAVRRAAGFSARARYRPGHASLMARHLRRLSARERRAAYAYGTGHPEEGDRLSEGLPGARRALVLDAAEDYVLYRHGFSPEAPPEVRALERPILVRRAQAPEPGPEPPLPRWVAPPEEGHARHRLTAGAGASRRGPFAELSWRPGYHDLLDASHGYPAGAAIEGFSGRLRWSGPERRAYVRDLRVIEILSAQPWDEWTRKPSWGLGTGLDTAFEKDQAPSRSLVYEGHLGTGFASALGDDALLFALVQAEGEAGAVLRDGWTVGGALRVGAAADLGAHVRLVLDGALSGHPFGDPAPNHRLRAGLNWSPLKDAALRVEALRRGRYQEVGAYAVLYH